MQGYVTYNLVQSCVQGYAACKWWRCFVQRNATRNVVLDTAYKVVTCWASYVLDERFVILMVRAILGSRIV